MLKNCTGGTGATEAEAVGATETVRAAEMPTEVDTVRSMNANGVLETYNRLCMSAEVQK